MKIDRTGAKVVGLVLGLFLFLGPLCGSANAECEWTYYSTPEIEVSITSPSTESVCCVNEEVTFTCEASDKDTKCQYDPDCEDVSDSIASYAWTAQEGAGSWSDADKATATWTAPDEAGTYTITITVHDAADAEVPPGCGTVDDPDPGTASIDILVIDGLTVVPREAYVCVNGTKDFEAWACVEGSIEEVTEDATFTTSKGSMGPGGGPGNNTLTASSTPSGSEGGDWVKATYDGQSTDDEDHWCKLTVIKVEVKSVTFTSDHGALTDYNTDYAGAGGTVYDPRGWQKVPPKNNPITHEKGQTVSANVTVKVEPSGMVYELHGDSDLSALDFSKTGQTSTGADQTISVTGGSLEGNVDILEKSISWSAKLTGPEPDVPCSMGSSGAHKIYVTWGTPGSGSTLKRVNYVCDEAKPASTKSGAVDKLHDAVASDTTFGDGGVDGWALLHGGTGECDNQARCMTYTVVMLGAGPATVQLVRASSNSGAGNCLDQESRPSGERTEYLILDFDTGAGYSWNAFEGCCEAAGSYYSITPKHKTSNDYTMLQALSCQQYWVLTVDDIVPGEPEWAVQSVIEEEPKP